MENTLLPHSDELNISYLSRLFDNTTNCYKFFWFQAILDKLDGKHTRFTFDELINEMIADAWYMVTEYHLRLGPLGITDNLEEVVKYIFAEYDFRSSEKREQIIDFLQNTDDKKIVKYKSDLTLNVPYRLQVPFYDEVQIERNMWNGSKKNLTEAINRQRRLMYYFVLVSGLGTEIEVDALWAEYLFRHKEILKGWEQLKLIQYLQNKNPSVPGIAEKIEAPAARDIERVRKYWKLIVQVDPSLRDIYGAELLKDVTISVDHFVPWQYVAHDELWNLHPTTRSINSSKSNLLPSWKMYFEPLGNIEYRAYELKAKNESIAREFEKIAPYHLNNQEIRNQLYADGLTRDAFLERLEHVIKPVYETAQTLGFKEWIYDDRNNV
ncbi:HNH endonuclease [Lachnospiraceae bacterium XBB1006]|nr:HNH endonuclease [Lachnospiraceae bacterium XBB1006]